MNRRQRKPEQPMLAEEYKAKVSTWFAAAKAKKSQYLIVALDTNTHNLFPVYVSRDTNIQTKIKSFNDNHGARAMEIYNINMDLATQLGQARVWNV